VSGATGSVKRESLTVLGVDPGKAVGCGVWQHGHFIGEGFELQAREFEDWLWEYLDLHVKQDISDRIVIGLESFDISARTLNKTADAHWPLDVIGSVKFIARRHGAEVVMRKAVDAKKFATDYKLREMGLWNRKSDHARDGVRHAILRLAEMGIYDGPAS
jgi:hypothetical protein